MRNEFVNIVVEDLLSELVAKRLLSEAGLQASQTYGKQGYGYIKKCLRGFNSAAVHARWLVLVDLDQNPCAATLADAWLNGLSLEPNLCFRIAIREIESWILGDIENLHAFLKLRPSLDSITTQLSNPDTLQDPKLTLLQAAVRSRSSSIREAVVHGSPETGYRPGPDYNGTMARFVLNVWNPSRASTRSESLRRARERIQNWR